MTKILIVHGVGGYPEENWFLWLKKELENRSDQVLVPQFPTPEGQTLSNWLKVLEKYKIDKDTIVVGHSLGVPFLLNVIEKQQVKAAFLVAGFVGKAGNKFDDSMKTFAQRDFDWQKIKKNCKRFYVFHSDNDPYISLDKAKEVAEKLGVKIILIKGAGHFNSAAGYDEFPKLLKKILTLKEKKKKN